MHLRQDGFRESGAQSANLDIRSRTDNSVQSLLGARIERPFALAGIALVPALNLEWRHEFNTRSKPLEASLQGGGGRFKIPGRDRAGDMLLAGVSLKADFHESVYCNFSYDLEVQGNDGYTGHALRLQMVVKF